MELLPSKNGAWAPSRRRVVVFPGAGVAPSSYAHWTLAPAAAADAALHIVNYPARGVQASAEVPASLAALIDASGPLLARLGTWLDPAHQDCAETVVLFGHSMGARVAAAVAQALPPQPPRPGSGGEPAQGADDTQQQHGPRLVIVTAASHAPDCDGCLSNITDLAERTPDALLDWMIAGGGIPKELCGQRDILRLLAVPPLHADLRMIASEGMAQPCGVGDTGSGRRIDRFVVLYGDLDEVQWVVVCCLLCFFYGFYWAAAAPTLRMHSQRKKEKKKKIILPTPPSTAGPQKTRHGARIL
jgi:surfactin synthase thioesterase subunit